jgi:hypothetical protein
VPINQPRRQLFKPQVTGTRKPSLEGLMGVLSLACPDAAAFQYVDVDTSPNYTPADEVNVSCSVDVVTTVEVDLPRPLPEIAEGAGSVTALVTELEFSTEATEKLANATTGQADNGQWFAQRAGRITGSKMHAVYTKMKTVTLKPNTNSDALVKQVMGYENISENIPALKYGRTMEDEARSKYAKVYKARHHNVRVTETGLHVSASRGYIGASPDGLVSCDCCGQGVLEVKCPFSIAHTRPGSSNLAYLRGGTLAKSHQYFTQVQGQMAVTDRQWCDFFVFTKHGYYLERILFNPQFWSTVVANLEKFFVLFVAPELLSSSLRDAPQLPPLDGPSVEKTPVQVVPVSRKPPVLATKPRRSRTSKKKSVKPVYICGSCEQEVKEEEEITGDQDFAIGCDSCLKWYHWGCVGFTGSACNQWYCPDCATVG